MLRRMLSAAILTALMQGCWSPTPSFAQDQNGQMMQTEKKMGETTMKNNNQQMMNGQKNSHQMAKKKHGHKKSKKNSDKMKSTDPNRM